jgi:hypothetical protein
MALCPVDGKGCCDDLCYGGGCIRGGGEMLHFCHICEQYHDDEDSFDECDGGDDDDFEDDFDPYDDLGSPEPQSGESK